MIKERKAPHEWTTWEDFANCYNLVIFNECTNLINRNEGNEEGVYYEWLEHHDCNYEEEGLEQCECEVFQWYAIACIDSDKEFLNEYFELDIFWSEVLKIHILPVYHFGTSWSHVSLTAVKPIE
jgi:hypothetical protein